MTTEQLRKLANGTIKNFRRAHASREPAPTLGRALLIEMERRENFAYAFRWADWIDYDSTLKRDAKLAKKLKSL